MPRDYLLPLLSVCLFVIQLGLSVSDLPSIKLMQDIVCRHVHRIDSPELLPEEKCRDEPVQQRLNFIMMGMQISATISATLVAFPLGVLSDRISRLPVLGASILSMILSQSYAMFVRWKSDMIPLEAIWCIGVALLVGGGRSVAEAMVFAIIVDTWVMASGLAAQLEGPVLSVELVQSSVWMPLFLSLGLVLGGGITLVSIGPYDYGLESNVLSLESLKRTSVMVAFKSMFSRPLLRLIPVQRASQPFYTYCIFAKLGHTSHPMHTATCHHMYLEQTHTFANSSQMLKSSLREFVAILSWLPLHDDGNKGSLHRRRPSRVGTGLRSTYAMPVHVS
ncbi:hypothetical protein FOWG_07757 [Fusarium oxysporum f. sp. lycopersici MN25]|nr:hypothetical protein FOWG_07757 [Fusarium oxysporum f. sp. lycopersici MN25]